MFSPAPGSPFATNSSGLSAAVGDFNGDGHADLAVATIEGNNGYISVLLGNGSGGFTAASGSPFATGEGAWSVAVGDFNGDGHADLAAGTGNNPGAGHVAVLLGNGSGGFTAASGSPYATGEGRWSVAVGDFNGDGHTDLAVTGSVLLGNGSGDFSPAPGSPVSNGGRSVAVGDFNGDGHADLAIAIGSEVRVLLGNGSGDFSLKSSISIAEPYSLAVGDFNGDGRADLAIANKSGNDVAVLLGDGSGGFAPATGSPFAVGTEPYSVAVGDFNGDGRADLAVVNENNVEPSAGTVSVLLGDGSGGFAPATGSPFAVGGRSWSVAVGDFNADGASDLAVPSSQLGTLSVLLNQPPHTSITGGPLPATHQRTATFSFTSSSEEAPVTFECRLDGAGWTGCTSPTSYSGLRAGAHSFDVRSISGSGDIDRIGATSNWSVDLSTPPVAALAASPDLALTGQSVTLDASASHDPLDGTIVDYKWDPEGSGNFERDTSTNPTTSVSYAMPGIFHPQVQVTNELGTTATATATVDVRPAPPAGEVGVSIDNGNYATNTTAVQLYVVWPAFASRALISNDGGFNAAGETKTVAVGPTIPWTLRSEGSERLPKIAYLRFPDSASPTQTFSDDIILDTTTPVIQSASTTETATTSAIASARRRAPLTRVRLKASEKVSGISAAQFSAKHSGGTTLVFTNRTHQGIRELARVVKIRMAKRPRFVRVRSAAGTWSKWHPIRRR